MKEISRVKVMATSQLKPFIDLHWTNNNEIAKTPIIIFCLNLNRSGTVRKPAFLDSNPDGRGSKGIKEERKLQVLNRGVTFGDGQTCQTNNAACKQSNCLLI